jgi:1-acyl-sn-glycerol-3-phosphate acyltransferase
VSESNPLDPKLSPLTPSFGNRFTRCIGRGLLRLLGWKVCGELPNIPKLVLAAGPHTSNWDFIIAMLAVLAFGVKISYLMKKEAFFWPFKSLFMSLGGIPIDRKGASGTVSQAADWFDSNEKIWVVVTPEGTRKKVERWKTGFLRIADQAQVPVFLVAWDYPNKVLHLDKLWERSGDHSADAEAIRHYINSNYTARHPTKQ